MPLRITEIHLPVPQRVISPFFIFHSSFFILHSSRLLIALAVLAAASPADAALIRLRESVTITSPLVTLGDVAEIRDVDEPTAAKLRSVVLAPAPAPERALQLDFDAVRSRLRALGFDLHQLEFTGASGVRVTSPAIIKTVAPRKAPVRRVSPIQQQRIAEQIEQAVARHVAARVPQLGRVHVEPDLKEEQFLALLETDAAGWRIQSGRIQLAEAQLFEIDATDRSGEPRQVYVPCALSVSPRVLSVRAPIERGSVVQEQDLVWIQVAPDAMQADMLDRIETAAGREAVRGLKPGMPLRAADIRQVPLVRSGEIVTIFVRRRGFTIKTDAKARGTGGLGEVITAATLDGREKLQVRVSGLHEAVLASEPAAGRE